MLRCVIFDLDNTLVDSPLDFAAIKAEIGTDQSILEFRDTVGPEEQRRIDEILDRHEAEAAAASELFDGAHELLGFLERHDVRSALLTRNSRKSVDTILERHALRFDAVVSREDSAPKPSPEPVLLICERLGVQPASTVMVGDFLYDIQSGQAAGTKTMLMDSPHRHRFEIDADYEVGSLREALEVIRGLVEQ